MIRSFLLFSFLLFSLQAVYAQKDSAYSDADSTLENVTVSAFSLHSKWKNVPASVAIINEHSLQRLDEQALLPSFNAVPGIRMEERSPGSYRLSIRGSLLRSPFGIRNIKIYLNDIPFTDAGGNSYLQLLTAPELQGVEILKGPASSYYGANTGGAVILHPQSFPGKGNEFEAGISAGFFGSLNENFRWKQGGERFSSTVSQSHNQSDSYRQQSAIRNDHLQWNAGWNLNDKTKLSFFAFYGNLHYETPGGLTLEQMMENPKSARVAAGSFPGAVDQRAGVYNETFFLASTIEQKFSEQLANTTTLVANHTEFKNPFITNYEKRNEWNYSVRSDFHFSKQTANLSYSIHAGGEWQFNRSEIYVYGNNFGRIDTVQYKDEIKVTNGFLFTQIQLSVFNQIFLQAGLSANGQRYRLKEITSVPPFERQLTEGPVYCPRISVLYKLFDFASVYGIIAKGFSPPTLAEVRPSSGNFNAALGSEYGWNYEIGLKGSLWNNRLFYDLSAYDFELKNAIVRRNDSIGAEYFVNAGRTAQKGIEAFFKVNVFSNNSRWIRKLSFFNSFSYQPTGSGATFMAIKIFPETGLPAFQSSLKWQVLM